MTAGAGFIELGFEDPRDRNRVVVEWLLSSVCNYRCTYCPDELHDGRLRWPSWDLVEPFCHRVADHYGHDRLTFLLTGGEPTLYPHLFLLADVVHARGGSVAVLSNGSRPLRWWERAVGDFDEVVLSYHRESADPERFVEVAAFLASRIPVQVNVVMPPDHFDECRSMATTLQQAAPDAVVHEKPLMDRWRRVHGYDADQRAHLLAANRGSSDSGRRFPHGTSLKGDLVARGPHDDTRVVTPIELIVDEANHWKGWECSIGLDTLFVRGTWVYRAVCGVGGSLGSIADPWLSLPTAPVTCAHETCTCIAGIKSAKRSAGAGRAQRVELRPRADPASARIEGS